MLAHRLSTELTSGISNIITIKLLKDFLSSSIIIRLDSRGCWIVDKSLCMSTYGATRTELVHEKLTDSTYIINCGAGKATELSKGASTGLGNGG